MKRLVLALIFCFCINITSATEYSDFAEKEYAAKNNKNKAHITVKKEHVEKYAQEIGCQFIPYIAYGYGDLKTSWLKKQRISYICLLDNDLKPLWSYVITTK